MTLYEILGVARNATLKQIRAAYRKLSQKHHPDKGGDREEFQRVKHAHDVLTDPERRKHYDETGDDTEKPKPPDRMLQMLVALFKSAIINDEDNPIAAMKASAHDRKKQLIKERVKIMEMLGKWKTRLPKIKNKKGEENLFASILQQQIDLGEVELKQTDAALAFQDEVIARLNDYEFEGGEMIVRRPPMNSMFASLIFSGYGQ